MSVVINDKPRRQRVLNWRWPFSRQITLSLGTLAVILAVWWTVAALQLISPLFLPPPGQVLQKLIVIAGPQGCMEASGGESDAYCYRAAGGSAAGRSGWDRDGAESYDARHSRSDH